MAFADGTVEADPKWNSEPNLELHEQQVQFDNIEAEDFDVMSMPNVGDSIEVFWPDDDKVYPALLASYDN